MNAMNANAVVGSVDVRRVETGIPGLDEMLGGGIPEGHTVVVVGSFGTGKTTFGLQFLWHGLQRGEKGIFISLEEDEEAVISTAASFGWDLRPHIDSGSLVVVKLEPADAKSTVTKIKSDLPGFIKNMGAKRLVLDSVSLLTMMFDRENERRETLFHLAKLIKDSGCTAVFTAEARPDNPTTSRDGLAEYTADGVIQLRYHNVGGDVQLVLGVVKMRRTAHSRRLKPYVIGSGGIVVQLEAEAY